jgi:HK97 gp10 family phage protein
MQGFVRSMVIRVHGVEDCLAAFRDLPMSIQHRHMRIALNAAGGVIRDAAVGNAPKDTGLLKKSLKVKVKIPDASYNSAHHGRPAYAVIGPSRNVVGVQTFRKSGARGVIKTVRLRPKQRLATSVRRPSRYAHLVERGTRRGTKATWFLRRAVSSSGEMAKDKMIQKLKDGLREFAATRPRRSFAMAG